MMHILQVIGVIFISVFIPVAMVIYFVRKWTAARTCPVCLNRSLKKIADNANYPSVEKLYPDKFRFRQYQVTFKCESCGYSKTEVRHQDNRPPPSV